MAALARKQLIMKRQTKGAVLYESLTSNGSSMITSIYLRKSGFPTNNYPGTIHVVIECDEEASNE